MSCENGTQLFSIPDGVDVYYDGPQRTVLSSSYVRLRRFILWLSNCVRFPGIG